MNQKWQFKFANMHFGLLFITFMKYLTKNLKQNNVFKFFFKLQTIGEL